MDNIISEDKSITIEIKMKTMDWAGELIGLFSKEKAEMIHKAIQELRTKYNSKFDITTYLRNWTTWPALLHIGLSPHQLP
jgi:hypothetical protein